MWKAVGLAVGLAAGLAVGLVVGLAVGLPVGLAVAVATECLAAVIWLGRLEHSPMSTSYDRTRFVGYHVMSACHVYA